jgi:hypothetical protein
MRKIAFGAVVLAGVPVAAMLVFHQPHSATAGPQFQARELTNVRALEAQMDLKALPNADVENGED